MEPAYEISSFYDKNWCLISLYRQTDGQRDGETDRSIKTEGPIVSFTLDLEYCSNFRVTHFVSNKN